MSVVVFGAGYLGTKLAALEGFGAQLSRVDIADERAVRAELERHRATVVVNAAGKTGRPNVDWCESHPMETIRSNLEGPLVLARVAAEAGAYLLHLASGCIFYGPSPRPEGFLEDDYANPRSLYSRTKYAADLALSRLPEVAVVRLRMPIDRAPDPRNLITKLAGYRQVIDVANSVTIVDDLLLVVRALVERRATGVFHATNPGVMRHRELLSLYRELVDPAHDCEWIDESELERRGLVQASRSNCILASPNLAALGIAMRPVDVALRETMERYGEAVRRGV